MELRFKEHLRPKRGAVFYYRPTLHKEGAQGGEEAGERELSGVPRPPQHRNVFTDAALKKSL